MISPSPAVSLITNLPYISTAYDPRHDQRGVVIADPSKYQTGLNFFNPVGKYQAYLIDMTGLIVWRWSLKNRLTASFRQFHQMVNFFLLPATGEVLVDIEDGGIIRADRDGRIKWWYKARTHHDLWIDDRGDIWALQRAPQSIPGIDPNNELLVDSIIRLSPTGELLEKFSLLDVIEKSRYQFLLPRFRGLPTRPTDGDNVFHTNHVEWFDGSLAKLSPLYRRGNLLVSLRNLNTIMILDGTTHEILWLWGPGNLTLQHSPVLLPNGDVLVFNNGRGFSSVVEVNPMNNLVAWRYGPIKGFFSSVMGSCQRLANGDTLITSTTQGRAFEVTPAGQKVWEYANPDVRSNGNRHAIWRMTRYDPRELPFLRAAGAPFPP